MGIQYVNCDWVFDRKAWSLAIHSAAPEDLKAACYLTGLTLGGLYHWMRAERVGVFEYPSMHNFLEFCNLLHLTPSDYFKLEETK